MKSKTLQSDIEEFVSFFSLSHAFMNGVFLITGATGLIGSILIRCLVSLNLGIKIIAPVRNKKKAVDMFFDIDSSLYFIECDIATFDYNSLGNVDYIVHCAAPTASQFFIEKPVETFNIIVNGTQALLEYAKDHPIRSFVYLSSLEVYGVTEPLDIVSEEVQGYWSLTDIRSCYPIAKRSVEHLCHLYSNEYNVPVKIARLTQTTGAGIAKDDNRVIAQFARCIANKQDIVLHSTGESARPYCYTIDAISALLYILLLGEKGQPYNVANRATYISARDLAEFAKDNFAPDINIIVDIKENMGYAPPSFLPLNTSKLELLGWCPKYGLKEIFEKLISYLNE
mgnify:FL=1